MARRFDVVLVGVGGQGVLTIAELLSGAAAEAGIPVLYYPSKGMAQRGGFVKAQVRFGGENVGPNIPERGADLGIALERSEALKAIRFIKPGGEFVLFDEMWLPSAVMLGKADYPSLAQVEEQVRRAGATPHTLSRADLPLFSSQPAPDNIFLLGYVLGQTRLGRLLDPERVGQSVRERWTKSAERNLFALHAGLDYVPV